MLERIRCRFRRGVVLRIQVQDHLPGLDGRSLVAERFDVQPGRARQEIGACLHVAPILAERQLLVDVDEVRPTRERPGVALHLAEGILVIGIGAEDGPPGLHRGER